MRRRRFASGTMIFDEGDVSHEAYLVRAGRIEVLKASTAGPLRLAVLGPGDVLGEMGLLDERPRSASARALEDTEVDAVSAAEFADLLTTDPTRSIEVLRAMFERLRAANARLSDWVPGRPEGDAVPTSRLLPLTSETEAVLPPGGRLLERFPFRVGRAAAHPSNDMLHFNEIELPDVEPYVLSPNHFAVDLGSDGMIVRDRGSRHGTVVNGQRIGAGAATDVAPLHVGENEVVAGPPRALAATRASPFRFCITLA
jgi:hypothetical protein